MAHYTPRQLIRYRFDSFMAGGGKSIFIGLLVFFITSLIFIGGLRGVVNLAMPDAAERDGGFLHQLYQTFNHLSDPGTMAYDIDSSGWFKLTAMLAGVVGVVILSSLIAFITTAMDLKISDLRKGHSKVIEEGHTLILGWNERVLEVLRELLIANESEDDPCVVILSDQDKEFMDDYLHLNLPDTMNTRIVTRSGSVSSLVNLDIVSVADTRSVIVLATCGQGATNDNKAASDTIVIKTVLALMASKPDDVELHIVAEIFDDRNRDIVEQICPEMITTIDTDEILAKIMVQTSRSVGLSVVYGEILSFDGCEMYFHHDNWGDTSFSALAFHWPDGVPMGLQHADGTIAINPHPATAVKPDDAVLILAEDDSTIEYLTDPVAVPADFPLADRRRKLDVERELIIGWTPKVEIMLHEYADYVLDGSTVDILLRAPDESVRAEVARINADLPGIAVSLMDEDPLTIEGLMAVEPFKYDNIIILSQAGGPQVDDERTDSETIVILLLLRRIFDENQDQVGDTKLITEVLDSDNQPLVARTGVRDFIISNRFVSMVLAQLSEDIEIKKVYDDLFQEDGSEIYVKPASLYFESLPVDVSFADLMRMAQKREEVCLGVKIQSLEGDLQKNFGVKLIPDKNTRYQMQAEDALVVVAVDET